MKKRNDKCKVYKDKLDFINENKLIVNQDKLKIILTQLLMSQVKLNDAPASSQTHFDYAVVELKKLIGEYEIQNEECNHIMNNALEHMSLFKSIDK